MNDPGGIWAVVPVKEFANAKQRLAGALTPDQRRGLCAAMLEDVLNRIARAGIEILPMCEAVTVALGESRAPEPSGAGLRAGAA